MNKKIGRNDPCPYGGGKKYKNVVLTKIQIQTWVRTQPWIIREGGADIFLDSERGKDKCIPKNRKSEH